MILKAPDGVGAVGFEGKNYPVKDGVVEVPDAATILLEPGYDFAKAEDKAKKDK